MQSNLCKVFKVVQILQKLKLYNKLKMKIMNLQLNIMIVDIDKKNKIFQIMNILQLKWILLNLISKNNYNIKLNKVKKLITILFIIHQKKQLKF